MLRRKAPARSRTVDTCDSYGGYEYEFQSPLPDECPCLVCTLVQKDPHQVTCCGKIFCKTCLDQLVGRKKPCPNCRSNSVKDHNFFPDLNTERKIKQLKIYCRNKKKGCAWIGCLKDMELSHIPVCPNEIVHCTNKTGIFYQTECGAAMQRHELQHHMTQLCQWRRVSCNFCGLINSFHFINGQHIHTCPNIKVDCKNEGCNEQICRKDLQKHEDSCPKKKVSCRYSSVGCTVKIPRESIQTHNKECMEEHLDKAVAKLEKALERIDKLEEADKPKARNEYDNEYYDDDEDQYYDDDRDY